MGVVLDEGAAVVVGAVGLGTVTEPDGCAATALVIAACSRFCASPYAAKSPLFRAA